MDADEHALIQSALRGDREAFEAVIRAYGRRVHGLAFGICQDTAEAEDITLTLTDTDQSVNFTQAAEESHTKARRHEGGVVGRLCLPPNVTTAGWYNRLYEFFLFASSRLRVGILLPSAIDHPSSHREIPPVSIKPPGNSAFTWIEAIVALAIFVVLALLGLNYIGSRVIACKMSQPLSNMKQLHLATMQMVLDGETTKDTNLAWPGDTGGTFSTWTKLLVPSYLSTNDLASSFPAQEKSCHREKSLPCPTPPWSSMP